MSDADKITDLLSATAEVLGQEVSPAALLLMTDDLEMYGASVVAEALRRVRRECRRFALADVIERIDDGRLGVEEAWAMMPKSEHDSVVWTAEMRDAYFVASPLLAAGDKIGARMAFKEKYSQLLTTARAGMSPVKWEASMGHDPAERETVLIDAIAKNRLTGDAAQKLLPSSAFVVEDGGVKLLQSAGDALALLPAPDVTVDKKANAKNAGELLKKHFDKINYKPKKANHLISVGTIRDGMRFVGGDPANAHNWEDVA